ncbi:hypothetical protein H6503_02675 [Candidatus Woesearchaeota archaeon]|nr:hypothetical protein [Candidatus Woesearchaeota archaeon]
MYKSDNPIKEFMLTFGWGFLVIIVGIGMLVFFDLLGPSTFIPSTCELSDDLKCIDFDIGYYHAGYDLNSDGRKDDSIISIGGEEMNVLHEDDSIILVTLKLENNLAADMENLYITMENCVPVANVSFIPQQVGISFAMISKLDGMITYDNSTLLSGEADKFFFACYPDLEETFIRNQRFKSSIEARMNIVDNTTREPGLVKGSLSMYFK